MSNAYLFLSSRSLHCSLGLKLIKMISTAILCVDQALGRLDNHSLSDQALMEMLIDGMEEEHKELYQDENGNFLDVCEWEGIECADDRVEYLFLAFRKFTEKPFPFNFIPPHVQTFRASDCNLHGTLETGVLPSGIKLLNVESNALHGTLSLKAFPRAMEKIWVTWNALTGSLVLSDLPQSLKKFGADFNKFCGEIDLNDLPPALENLSIGGNALTGSINIESLPDSIRHIDLSENAFSKDFRMCMFPPELIDIDVTGNPLSGTVVLLKAEGPTLFDFRFDGLLLVVDENGDKHEWHDKLLKVNRVEQYS